MLARRTFIRNLALVSAAVALRPTGLSAAAAKVLRPRAAADLLTGENFGRLRGERFTVAGPGGAQSCVLARVERSTADARLENFSLHFEGSAAAALPGGTYRFSHHAIGEIELFVSARPVDARSRGYEAVINRLV